MSSASTSLIASRMEAGDWLQFQLKHLEPDQIEDAYMIFRRWMLHPANRYLEIEGVIDVGDVNMSELIRHAHALNVLHEGEA